MSRPMCSRTRGLSMSEGRKWADVRKLLCVRLDNMGDVLMTTPALRALKQSGPDRHLTLLASRPGCELAPYLEDVDEVIAYNAPWVKHAAYDAGEDEDVLNRLRAQEFDAAVIFTVYSQSALPAALFCRMAGIPRVLAYCRENPYALISDWVPETEPMSQLRHEVQRQLDLVAHIGAVNEHPTLRFRTLATHRHSLSEKLAARGWTGASYMVAHCGASAPSRRYPAESFAHALKLIGTRAGTIVLSGDHNERDLVDEIATMCGTEAQYINVAGDLGLGEFACLLESARLLLSNNTGPVHLAAAFGTPVVDLYALTNPQHTPWMVPQRVLFQDVPCKYCYRSVCPEGHHACLRGVSPQAVCEAVVALQEECGASSVPPLAQIV